jgi:acetyl-CoA carboxylase biotin carboxylase subunit
MVTGRDLVKGQIQVAGNEPLPYSQEEIEFRGAAIECRITAEDPERGFAPSPGIVTGFHVPGGPGVRVDTHVYTDYTIPACYDSLIAKLITWGLDREEAIARMRRALDEFVIQGVDTTIPLHRRIMDHQTFLRAAFFTDFVEQELKI